MMMIVIILMIASYTNDDDRHRDDDRIVHIVYALAMYDAMLFGDGRTGMVQAESFPFLHNLFSDLQFLCLSLRAQNLFPTSSSPLNLARQ